MFSNFDLSQQNVRKYQKGTQILTIQRNWRHRVHKMKKNKTKTQHIMYWTPLYMSITKGATSGAETGCYHLNNQCFDTEPVY